MIRPVLQGIFRVLRGEMGIPRASFGNPLIPQEIAVYNSFRIEYNVENGGVSADSGARRRDRTCRPSAAIPWEPIWGLSMTKLSIAQTIESCGFCRAEEVEKLQVMKAGMTNRSYSFCVRGKRYMIRIPGEGTEQLISRAREHEVYRVVSPLGISEDIHYFDPVSGIKIASYLENARPCDSGCRESVGKCMAALRNFHRRRLSVGHTFDLWERLDFYESLWGGAPSCHADYPQVRQSVLALRRYLDEQPKEYTLCHIDAVPDNFLFVAGQDGREEIRLIDWEYAGMQDPHLDIAMFAVYAMYDRQQVDELIGLYFPEGCGRSTRLKIYCYIAVSGLLWSNWCEFKRHCGVEFGVYAQRQYDYAREYPAIFLEEYRKEFGRDYV